MSTKQGRLSSKTAIITGAASGIGKGTALLFAEEGANLILVDISEDKLNEVAAEIRELGGSCEVVCGSVGLMKTAEEAVALAVSTYGKLDILFNNAGIMPVGDILDYAEETWDQVLQVNLKSMFLMCKKAIPEMLKANGGSIINTSSVMANLTEPGYTAYSASKAGIIGLTKEIAVSYTEKGIRCNSIAPGWVETDMNVKLADSMGGMDKLYPIIKQQQPLGRMATTREVAYAVLFLASDESIVVSGSHLAIDGAASAAI
ncbi:SDR family NAD(P)-dependent oxidoreductase [Cohnella abietis]|uniref:3-oxoacyl-[acyl-carrier-protein] reductase FabG n=1 Tax=Cohnella abietis TaxID=2507935 RepID=A0A3T1DCL9_9BACL|nr:SDR family oxidoreductase [Cohnella abietis]BBI35843.1 3-oxoacyl-[acyl-carrier-protein] reductase FabG [Cohnella abietis]